MINMNSKISIGDFNHADKTNYPTNN